MVGYFCFTAFFISHIPYEKFTSCNIIYCQWQRQFIFQKHDLEVEKISVDTDLDVYRLHDDDVLLLYPCDDWPTEIST